MIYLRLLLLLLLVSATVQVRSQNLRGLWVGGLVSDTIGVPVINTNYVVHVKQQNGNIVSGRAYVLERRFVIEGILDFIGMIKNNRLIMTELRVSSSKIPIANRYLCLKNLDLKITIGAGVENMQGHWTGKLEDRTPCTAGSAVLNRYNVGTEQRVIPAPMMQRILADTGPVRFLNTELAEPVVISVSNRNVRLSINDYLREDNDTVSVYQNRRPFIKNLAISNIPYLKTLRFDVNSDMQELVLYAENLGRVPPNTSTLTIDDGVKVQKVSILANKQVSAVIYLKYDGK